MVKPLSVNLVPTGLPRVHQAFASPEFGWVTKSSPQQEMACVGELGEDRQGTHGVQPVKGGETRRDRGKLGETCGENVIGYGQLEAEFVEELRVTWRRSTNRAFSRACRGIFTLFEHFVPSLMLTMRCRRLSNSSSSSDVP